MSTIADQYYQEGITALQTGIFSMAQEMFSKATEQDPSRFEFWNLLGLAHQFQQQWRECDRAWREALRCKPASADTLLNLGIANIALGNDQEAEGFWLSILDFDANHVRALINLGLFYRERKRNLLAHQMWARAFGLMPDNPQLQEWIADVKGVIGMVHLANHDFDRAEKYLKEAVVMDPEYDVLWGYLAEWHFQRKEFKEAFATCTKGLAISPENAKLHHTMGNILRMTAQEEEALLAYKKAIELGLRHPATYRAVIELNGLDEDEDLMVIQQLFDQYANNFELDLQQNLGYATPTQAAALYQRYFPKHPISSILDLGAGTGLSLEPFWVEKAHTVGVDISQNMLDKAKEKNIYAELHCQSLKDYLSKETRGFDLVLCLDTFVYLRNLGEIFSKIRQSTNPKGVFLFSTEKNDAETPLLQSSGRYSHPQPFLENLLRECGWQIISVTETLLRKEGEHWIKGNIWIAQKE